MIDLRKLPKTDFAAAIVQIAGERGIDPKVVVEAVKSALLAAFFRDAKERGEELPQEWEYTVELNQETGEARIFAKDEQGKKRDVTPPGFGRIAAQAAKQVILQKIREAEKAAILNQFAQRVGTITNGVVLRLDGRRVIVGIGKAEAILPPKERIPGERYHPTQRLVFYIKEIAEIDGRRQIIVSRSDPALVVELFRREVPEVASGAVEIVAVARDPGVRTKIAVTSKQRGVDPVGACVGQKGVRVAAVIKELGEEKIDVIPYNKDPQKFIPAALSPAQGGRVVSWDEAKKAGVVVFPKEELPMAIGERGENVRLAMELIGCTDLQVLSEEEWQEKEGQNQEKKTGKK